MRKKSILTFVVLAIVMVSATVSAQKLWSLEDCITYAFDNNLQIKQSELSVETANNEYLQRKLNLIPSLNASSSYNFGWGRSVDMATYKYTDNNTQQSYFGVSSDVTLFNGLQQLNSIRQKEFDYLAQKYNYEKIRNDMSLNIASAYLQILFNIELVSNAERQVEITNQQIERTKKQVDAGTVAKGNLLDVESQGATEQATLVNYKNRLMLAYLDLKQLLDLKGSDQFDIEKPELEVNLDASEVVSPDLIYRKAVNIMPEIKGAESQLGSAEKSLSISKGARYPRLTMSGGYNTNYSDQIPKSNNPLDPDFNQIKPFPDQLRDNRNITMGFRLAIPVFNGFQVSTQIKQSKIYYENANLNLQLEKNRLRKNIEQAYADALAAYQTYVAKQKSLAALSESFKYSQEKFNVGMINATDYNVAKIQLSNAESDLVSAKYDYIFKTRILNFYLGRPITLKNVTAGDK
ncbi:MAG: hypothetical protein DRJ09_04770 [Bacteroidetes bacterium]|nr:MAG: hypothetical protein DRJ09_04770 [Bacteroidota bacterium]